MLNQLLTRLRRGVSEAIVGGVDDAFAELNERYGSPTRVIEARVSRDEIDGLKRIADAEAMAERYNVSLTGERLTDMKDELIRELC